MNDERFLLFPLAFFYLGAEIFIASGRAAVSAALHRPVESQENDTQGQAERPVG
jgi:hypothetical protein